jgi:Mo25-like
VALEWWRVIDGLRTREEPRAPVTNKLHQVTIRKKKRMFPVIKRQKVVESGLKGGSARSKLPVTAGAISFAINLPAMSFLFKPKQKTPHELVKATEESILKLDAGDAKKVVVLLIQPNEEITKNLAAMKLILYGDGENDPAPELVVQLANEALNSSLLQLLVKNIHSFEFEVSAANMRLKRMLRRSLTTCCEDRLLPSTPPLNTSAHTKTFS